jgi:hypothetical protein
VQPLSRIAARLASSRWWEMVMGAPEWEIDEPGAMYESVSI